MNFSSSRYDTMTYRQCGQWGLKLPLISLGGWMTVGGYEDEDVAKTVFYRAFDAGVTHFDFANNYGTPAGNGEIVGGKILRDMPRDELIISSKAGFLMWPGPYGNWGSRKYIIASCDQSLKRMGLEYFDIFYHHRPDPDTPIEETHGALETLVQQGKVLYTGVSNYAGDTTKDTIELRRQRGWSPITIHQPRYNLLDRGMEVDLLPVAAKYGFGLIPYSPLAKGALTHKYLQEIPADSRYVQGKFKPDLSRIETVRKLKVIADNRGQSLAQMALAWILRYPQVTSVLTAVSRLSQLEDSLGVLNNLTFSAEELDAIEAAVQPFPS